MTSIPKVQGRLLNRKIHRRCAKCKGMFVIALAALLFAGCGWNDTSLDSQWIIGYWVRSYSYAPYTDLLHFAEEGKRYRYEDYDGTALASTKTWYLNGDALTVDDESYIVTKMGNDQYMQEEFMYYRKGTEPGGNIFDNSATVLTVDEWWVDTILLQTLKLFSYTAGDFGIYEISWDDRFDGSGSTTSDIIVSAYATDKITAFFSEEDSAYSESLLVVLSSGETIFIIVDAYWRAGSFRIRIR